MDTYICEKVATHENNIQGDILDIISNVKINSEIFSQFNENNKNCESLKQNVKLITLCVLSKVVYMYKNISVIDEILKSISCCLSYKIYNTNTPTGNLRGIVYGIFYTEDYIVISFKGTSTMKETLSDINFIQIDDKYSIPGKIHKGFHDLMFEDKVAETIETNVNKILDETSCSNVYITGHSLGGALATTFYAYLKCSPLSDKGRLNTDLNINLTTFGCPKVGDKEFSESLGKVTRVVNGNDIVTKIPVIGYSQPATKLQLGSKWSCHFISDHKLNNYYDNIIKLSGV